MKPLGTVKYINLQNFRLTTQTAAQLQFLSFDECDSFSVFLFSLLTRRHYGAFFPLNTHGRTLDHFDKPAVEIQ